MKNALARAQTNTFTVSGLAAESCNDTLSGEAAGANMAAYLKIDDYKNKSSGGAAEANTKLSGMAAYLNMG